MCMSPKLLGSLIVGSSNPTTPPSTCLPFPPPPLSGQGVFLCCPHYQRPARHLPLNQARLLVWPAWVCGLLYSKNGGHFTLTGGVQGEGVQCAVCRRAGAIYPLHFTFTLFIDLHLQILVENFHRKVSCFAIILKSYTSWQILHVKKISNYLHKLH